MNQRILPIFPVNVVLFPRQELSLNIFEPRYKQMVEDCMLGDGLFGVCLADEGNVAGWQSPCSVGTITKIIRCRDPNLDGLNIHIDTMGRSRFHIQKIIPPSVALPPDYDPDTLEGHQRFFETYTSSKPGKMYIQASVDIIPDIDQNISESQWKHMVKSWKTMIQHTSEKWVDFQSLDLLLQHYDMLTDMPTLEYVYALAALGSSGPQDLQPILEARTLDALVHRVESLLEVK